MIGDGRGVLRPSRRFPLHAGRNGQQAGDRPGRLAPVGALRRPGARFRTTKLRTSGSDQPISDAALLKRSTPLPSCVKETIRKGSHVGGA
jgi:hypothetical protein